MSRSTRSFPLGLAGHPYQVALRVLIRDFIGDYLDIAGEHLSLDYCHYFEKYYRTSATLFVLGVGLSEMMRKTVQSGVQSGHSPPTSTTVLHQNSGEKFVYRRD